MDFGGSLKGRELRSSAGGGGGPACRGRGAGGATWPAGAGGRERSCCFLLRSFFPPWPRCCCALPRHPRSHPSTSRGKPSAERPVRTYFLIVQQLTWPPPCSPAGWGVAPCSPVSSPPPMPSPSKGRSPVAFPPFPPSLSGLVFVCFFTLPSQNFFFPSNKSFPSFRYIYV